MFILFIPSCLSWHSQLYSSLAILFMEYFAVFANALRKLIMMIQKTKTILLCFALGLLVFTIGLYSAEIIKINCRYGLFAYEMDLSHIGPFPLLFGQPYTDYPSLHIILTALLTKLFGVNMLTITLPSAIAAATVLVVTYLIGERHSPRLGLIAVLLLCTSYQFLDIARAPSPDMFVALFSALAFFIVYTAELDKKRGRLWWLPLLALLSFFMRGPIGTIIPAAIVVSYYFTRKNYKMLFITGLIFTLILGISGAIMAGWAYLEGGIPLIEKVINAQVVGRLFRSKPLWFYFTDGVAVYSLALPLALFAIGTYFVRLRKAYFHSADSGTTAHLRQALTAWILIIMVGMSIPGAKHLRYIVPVMPAAALMAAFIFANPDKIAIFDKLRAWLINIFRYLPLTIVAILFSAFVVIKIGNFQLPFQIPWLLPMICFAILSLVIALNGNNARTPKYTVFILVLMAMGITIFKITLIDPIEQQVELSKQLVGATEKIRPQGVPVCFYALGHDGYELKYLINIDRKKKFMPIYVSAQHPEALLKLPYKNMPIIAKANKINNLQVMQHLKLIKTGRLSHRKCQLFVADLYQPQAEDMVKKQ